MNNLTLLVNRIREALVSEDSSKTQVLKTSAAFGRDFRTQRNARKITLREMAEMLEIGKSMLDSMETGDRLWTVERAEKAIDILARMTPRGVVKRKNLGSSVTRAAVRGCR